MNATSTVNATREHLSTDDATYVRWLQQMPGVGDMTLPMPVERATELYSSLGYYVPKRFVEIAFGELPQLLYASDMRRLHLRLENEQFWASYPNPYHDHKKPSGLLSIEIARYLQRSKPAELKRLAFALAPEVLLTLCAAAQDSLAQQTFLEMSLLRFGLATELPE